MADPIESKICILQEEQFNGPNPMTYSSRLRLQDGDNHQPQSINSFTIQDNKPNLELEISQLSMTPRPVPVDHRNNQLYHQKRSEYQSVYEDDIESARTTKKKPSLFQLLIAKTLQNNFLNNLQNRSYLRKLRKLSPFQIQALDDLQFEGYVLDRIEEETWFSQLVQFKVFTPYSKFIVLWDVFQIISYLLIFFWLPYKLSFEIHYFDEFLSLDSGMAIEATLLSLLASDVLVGCNLAFIDKGQIIRERKRVLYNYFVQYAFVDLVSLTTITIQFLIPSLSSGEQSLILFQVTLCAVFYILRITKINKILAQIQEFFNLNGSLSDILALMKLSMVIIFIAHICACTWHGIAHYNQGLSWLDAYGIRNASNGTRYNHSIYWATMTMTTVGYGDVTPQNNTEMLINNLTMFISSIVFAYSVNSIGIFVSNMYKGTMEYSRSVTLINTYMSKNKIQFGLQQRIRSYLEYIWQEEQQMNDDEVNEIIRKLSKHLQDELQYQIRMSVMKNCKLIINTFSPKMIKVLSNELEEVSYSPEEHILTIGQVDDGSLYIISKGEVEILFEGQEESGERTQRNSFGIFKQGSYFGEIALFTGQARKASAISRGFTKVFKIQRQNFLKVVTGFPEDYEKYCQILHQLNNYEYEALKLKCYSCSGNGHIINYCHYLHYVPDKEALIKRYNFPFKQPRNYKPEEAKEPLKQRGPRQKHKTLSRLLQTQFDVKDFQQKGNSRGGTELEEFESHSNIVNEYEDSQIEVDVPSTIQNRSNSRTFSRVSQKPDVQQQQISTEEDQIQGQLNGPLSNYLRRGTHQRQTVQTAGFGGAQSLRDKTQDNFQLDQDEDSSEPESSEEADKVPPNLPVRTTKPPEQPQRGQQQKITFTTSNNAEDVVPRQPSLRSRTYERRSNERVPTANQPQEKPTSELDMLRQTNRRVTQVKRQTHTKTEDEKNYTSVMDNQTQVMGAIEKEYIVVPHFDQPCIYKYYYPLYNYDLVIKRYAKVQKYFGKKRLYPDHSLFSFFCLTIKRGWKLRQLGEKHKKQFQKKNFQRKQMFVSIKDFGS